MKRNVVRRIASIIVALFMLTNLSAYAAGSGKIVEYTLKEDQLTAFVKNAGETDVVSATLGRTACEDVYFQTISDAGIKMYTLILVDNSLSIPEDSRTACQTELVEWIAARKGNEAFAVGTVSDQISIAQDFTDDYIQLKEIIEKIEYKNQETYLTDALYDYLADNPFLSGEGEIFYRILLISDGVDNKALGYTKDELLSLLEKTPVPIYTVGINGKDSNNNEELENMFALARATGGDAVLLQALSGTEASLLSLMEEDWSNLAVTAKIPKTAQDGSLQTLTITLQEQDSGSETVSLDGIRMPLTAADAAPEDAPVPAKVEPPEDKNPAAETGGNTPEENAPEEKGSSSLPVIGITAATAVLVLILAVILLSRRSKPPCSEAAVPQPTAKGDKAGRLQESVRPNRVDEEPEGTQRLEDLSGGDQTIQLWGQDEICSITLTDIHFPEKFYQMSMASSLIIGASRESDICVNYDRTVSRTHCEIIREGEDLFLINHSQSNGTLLNGIRVVAKTPLSSGNIIKMGRVEMRIEIDS